MSGPNKLDPRLLLNLSEHKEYCNMQIGFYYLLNPPKLIENMYFDKSSCCLCPSLEKNVIWGWKFKRLSCIWLVTCLNYRFA